MKIRRKICPSLQHQQGVALVISLVLMLAMTILGVATMSGTRLNEKQSSNAQQKSIAFQVAESGIAAVWTRQYLLDSIVADGTSAADNPAANLSPDEDTGLNSAFDQLTDGKGVDLNGTVSIQYCGEVSNVGSDLSADESQTQMVFMLVDINSVVDIENSSTQADHVLRTGITAPKTNRAGDCPAR